MIVDANQSMDPLCERVEREGITVTRLLLTHHHDDHVEGAAEVARRVGATVVASDAAARDLPKGLVGEVVADGAVLTSGDLSIRVIATPGHMAGHLAFLVDGSDCLTGDTLFDGTVGGTRVWRGLDAEGHAPCRVDEDDATLVLWAPDYDGGHKAWVRFDDDEDAIVGGSRVERIARPSL